MIKNIFFKKMQIINLEDFRDSVKTRTSKNFIKENELFSKLYAISMIDSQHIKSIIKKEDEILTLKINDKEMNFNFFIWFLRNFSIQNKKNDLDKAELILKKDIAKFYLTENLYVNLFTKHIRGYLRKHPNKNITEEEQYNIALKIMWEETIVENRNNKLYISNSFIKKCLKNENLKKMISKDGNYFGFSEEDLYRVKKKKYHYYKDGFYVSIPEIFIYSNNKFENMEILYIGQTTTQDIYERLQEQKHKTYDQIKDNILDGEYENKDILIINFLINENFNENILKILEYELIGFFNTQSKGKIKIKQLNDKIEYSYLKKIKQEGIKKILIDFNILNHYCIIKNKLDLRNQYYRNKNINDLKKYNHPPNNKNYFLEIELI